MYFGPGISVGRRGVSYGDSDAQAFIAATGITGTTEVSAINKLVANLKTYGLWSKMKAIYPFVSDTTNLVSYSEKFTNAAWTYRRATIVDDAVASPLGTNTATTFTEDTTTGTHEIGNPSAFSISSSQNVTISIYVKKVGSRDWFAITMYNNSGVDKVGYYNISNGTLGNFDAGITGTITSIGSGWYRISATGNFATTGNYFGFKGASANGTISYLGSGALQYNVWGAQLELGSTMTTYQPIATTPANRFVSQFKYNLKDPRDLDAAFRLAFNGTWTYTQQGATGNGTNAYANTYLTPSTTLGSTFALSYYSNINVASTSPVSCEIGAFQSGSQMLGLSLRRNLSADLFGTDGYGLSATSTSTTSDFYGISSRISTTSLKLWKNTTLAVTNTTTDTGTKPSIQITLNLNNGLTGYSNRRCAFSHISDGLTDTEVSNLYTSVQTFNQDLSRQVGVPIVSDSDAQSFLNAAVITDTTQANAINTLVVGLKNASLWTKMKAIYPFVGGTATTHKWNLKDPRDLDAAYRLAFSGAWTHSSTGALPNGTNAFADTFLTPSANLTANSTHASYYSRTNVTTNAGTEIGTWASGYNYGIELNLYRSVATPKTYAIINSGGGSASILGGSVTPTTGLLVGSRIANNNAFISKNGATIGTNTTTVTGQLATFKVYLGAANNFGTAGAYSNKESAFASIGDGITEAEATTLNTLVTNFETTLNRNV